MKYNIVLLILLCIVFVSVTIVASNAQFLDRPPKTSTIDIGITGDTHTRSGSVMFVYPIPKISGYWGIYGMYASSDGVRVSEIVKTHLQGRYSFNRFSIEGFVDTERNYLQGTDRESNVGYFIRPVEIQTENYRISGGLGNIFTNSDARNDLGLGKTDILNTPKWLGFVSISISDFTVLFRYSPELSFGEHELEIVPSWVFYVRDRTSVSLRFEIDYDSDPVHRDISNVHTVYDVVMSIRF